MIEINIVKYQKLIISQLNLPMNINLSEST